MTPEQAKHNLLGILTNGRIILNGLPLTGNELGGLQQSVLLLYEGAKDAEERKNSSKPDNERQEE